MKTTDKYPLLTQLRKYKRAIEHAREKVTELEAENRSAQRAVQSKAAALSDYYSSIGAGTRKPDAAEEARLRDGVTEAQADTVVSYSQPWQDESGKTTISTSNPRIEGMLAGARERVERLEEKLRAFKAQRFDDLAAEITPQAKAAQEQMNSALTTLAVADEEWRRVSSLWKPLLATGRLGDAMPDGPLDGLRTMPGECPLPMPVSLIPESELEDKPPPRGKSRTRRRVDYVNNAA